MNDKLKPHLLEVNHSPSFTCDSPMDEAVKTAVLTGTMEMVSFSKEEHKLIRKCPPRLTPELRERLQALRSEYELAHADRLGFDVLYSSDRADIDEPDVAELQAKCAAPTAAPCSLSRPHRASSLSRATLRHRCCLATAAAALPRPPLPRCPRSLAHRHDGFLLSPPESS